MAQPEPILAQRESRNVTTGDKPEERKLDETLTVSPAEAATVQTGSSRPQPTQKTPDRIGAYRVERELGRGGMGVVYLAEDPRLKRMVALKVLPDHVTSDAEALAHFQREAQLLAAHNHPNIATIHSLEDDQGLHFFTLELIEGQTLGQRISGHPMELGDALSFCRQVARALQAAHKQGVIHRDLKPANVMVTPDDEVKVLDFGIATAVGEAASRLDVDQESGVISGTPGYMSPEQLRGDIVDQRTDIWAFGCVLFECLTGHKAFEATTFDECVRVTSAGEVDWNRLPADTPPVLKEITERCLTVDLEARLTKIGEARRALEDLIALRAVAASRVEPSEPEAKTPNNLPHQLTTFVGRESQLADVCRLILETPLLTLTGSGGSGKTRLALEGARKVLSDFRDGVWLAEFAPLSDATLVARTVATALGIKEESQRPLVDSLRDHLENKNLLLVLDNCEHVITPCAELATDLLRGCPNLRILASSREGLGITGETIFHVPSLELPPERPLPSLAELQNNESVRLFTDRARSVNPTFELSDTNALAVVQVVRQLDGIPLALELAAARVKVLPVPEIGKRLADRFRLLTGGSKSALPRQKTLRATIDWSYDQLEENEQKLLRRLSVFSGGWDLESAELVCAGDDIEEWDVLDLLSHLVDKSLVEVNEAQGGRTRYRLLETIRQYSLDRLQENSEAESARIRHRDHFLALAEKAAPQLSGPHQAEWFSQLELEHGNLRGALQTCLTHAGDAPLGLRLGAAIGLFWLVRGHWSEGRDLLTELLAHAGAQDPGADRARALGCAARLAESQGDYAEAQRLAEASLEIERHLGNEKGTAAALNDLGIVAKKKGDLEEALSHFEESLSLRRKLKDQQGTAATLNNMGLISNERGDLEAAQAYYDESLGLLRSLGDMQGIAVSLNSLAGVAFLQSELDRAATLYEEALSISREIGNRRTERNTLNNLGLIAYARREYDRARQLYEESLVIKRELGDRLGMARSLHNLAQVALDQKDLFAARGYCNEGLAILRELDHPWHAADLLESLAQLSLAEGNSEHTARLSGAVESLRATHGSGLGAAEVSGSWLDDARASLGDERFTRLREEGRGLSLEEVCNLVLGLDPPTRGGYGTSSTRFGS